MRSHRRQPTRLPRPWDSPGKNTGVGCHFLLQCIKVKSESEVTWSCPTLSVPMDWSLPGSSVHGIFQARVLEWGAVAFSDFFLTYSHSSLLGLQRYVYLTLRFFFSTNNQNLFTFKKHFCFPNRSGFLYPRTIDILGQIISCPVWEGLPVCCQMFSSIPDLYH